MKKHIMMYLGLASIMAESLSFKNTTSLGHYQGGSYKGGRQANPTNVYNGKHTKKQMKARAKSKRGKQSRKFNRK